MTKTCEATHEMAAHGPCSMKPDHSGSHRNERGEFWTEASPLDDKVANMEHLARQVGEVEQARLDYIQSDDRSFLWYASDMMDITEQYLRDMFSPSDPLWPLLSRAVRSEKRLLDIELRSAR